MNARVLVVEDNEALAENIAELFEDAGAEVSLCATADEALASAAGQRFELAIVDLRLPGYADGLELVPRLRAQSPEGEIILVTGNASLDSAIAAVRHGAFAYVLKPFDPADLLTLGERALSQVALRREREALARELAESEALYRGVVDTVEALIVGLDGQGRIQFTNRFAAETIGQDQDALEGQPFTRWFADETQQGMLEVLVSQAEVEPQRDRQVALRTREGQRRDVRWTLTPLHTEGSAGASLLAVGLDVTERLELERRSAENEAMAAMGRLTTGIAHEIRNPLNAAKLQLELLARGARKLGDDKMSERAELVTSELARLSQMLEDFLSLARPRDVTLQPFALRGLFEEVAHLQGPLANANGIEVHVEATSAPEQVRADREKMKQVLLNLVGNAIDAMATQGGRITLSAHEETQGVEIRVADTGPGVPPEVMEELFQPFVTTKEAGTGLGLTVVKRIIEQHEGEVDLEAPEQGGTVARLRLPRNR